MPPATTGPSPAEVLAALQRGGVVEALKLVLAAKGGGLRGEKNLGGHIGMSSKPPSSASFSSKPSDLSPGEVPRSNNDIWLLLVLIAALYIAYYFFTH
jgi:hypothetical protein